MFEHFKENFINMITSRIFVMLIIIIGITVVMVHRIFDLQIVHGEEYLDSFQLKIMKERTIQGSRGCIYDRNGNLLAYNELAYSVAIEDVYESGKMKNANLNGTIYTLIQMLEKNGDTPVSDFKIILDKNNNFSFTVEGTQLYRFLADVYGHLTIDKLEEKEKTATASEVVDYLCGWDRFRIGNYTKEDSKSDFVPGNGYSKDEILKILTIRYDMNTNSFKKYIATTVATDVSDKTVAVVMENSNELEGVSIVEDTVRKYVDSEYFSQIIGYTGKVSQEELTALQAKDSSYDLNDTVGKLGIEKSMESELQGTKGSETVFVNSVGKVIETSSYVEPVAGNDIYLSIDYDLQIAATKILEQRLAGILYANIINAKEFKTGEVASSKIKIPIYDVYFALLDNNVIDIGHFKENTAGENEKAVYGSFIERKGYVFESLRNEMEEIHTPYEKLSTEYQVYESFIAELLYDNGIIMRDLVDKEDATYIAWTTDEVISLYEYLNYCIARNWIDVTKLDLNSQYSDSEEIYAKIIDYIFGQLEDNLDFTKKIYKYMIKDDTISGRQICSILLEQDLVELDDAERSAFENGAVSAYTFMMERIKNLDITPAQLALDPYSASTVITDVNTGKVLALVSYPSYDNNKMANGVDAEYFKELLNDSATPMINYATQHRTAPGSTFKMVTATAGLMEETINTATTFNCTGIFDKIAPPPACWNRGGHGSLNVTGGIKNSCNVFFFELAYRLGMVGDSYSSDAGLKKLETYAELYGLTEPSGVEIEEAVPQISDTDAVRSAIGQGTFNFTTTGISRYITTIANSGTCYNLTLLDKITDHSGNLLKANEASIRNTVDMGNADWNAIHSGMRQVIENNAYFRDISTHIQVAGKTGTAEENKNRANHALFVCYAPYDKPEISITTRIAYGYTSSYAAQTTTDIIKYYFNLADEEELITGAAAQMNGSTARMD